jgi:hypothetical protein
MSGRHPPPYAASSALPIDALATGAKSSSEARDGVALHAGAAKRAHVRPLRDQRQDPKASANAGRAARVVMDDDRGK